MGRALPASPHHQLRGMHLLLGERAQVLRQAAPLLQRFLQGALVTAAGRSFRSGAACVRGYGRGCSSRQGRTWHCSCRAWACICRKRGCTACASQPASGRKVVVAHIASLLGALTPSQTTSVRVQGYPAQLGLAVDEYAQLRRYANQAFGSEVDIHIH